MPSNLGFKNSSLLVNTDLVGLRYRVKKVGSWGNYALRDNWGCADRFRGVLGTYFAKYTTGGGSNFINFASDKINDLNLKNQVKDIPLTLRELPSTNDNLGPKSAKFLIELDNTAWNNLTYEGFTMDLLRQHIDEPGIEEGDPYWRWYLKSGMPAGDAGTAGIPLPPIIDTTTVFTDHSTLYYTPSPVKDIRAKSGAVIEVESVYNYYADTTPPYERISKQASEPMLTNFYCLESEMRNTGSTLNSPDYFAQITLNNTLQELNIDNDPEPDPWFQSVEGPEGSMTEAKTVQLYTLYSKGLNMLNGTPSLTALKSVFNDKYKNIVILNSDLKVMSDLVTRDDKTSGLSNLPFYNKITIGYDREGMSDPSEVSEGGSASWLREIKRDLDQDLGKGTGDQFIDILQLYIIQNLEGVGSDTTVSPFTVKNVIRLSDTDPQDLQVSVVPKEIPVVFKMEDFLEDIVKRTYSPASGLSSTRVEDIVERINTNTTTDDNFILIRNYNQNAIEVDELAAQTFLKLKEDNAITPYPIRSAKQIILENKLAVNETILYRITKRAIGPNGANTGPVQTFYIGRFFDQVRDIHYVDSQVKYGVRYRYNISEIKLVFGSKYSYTDLDLYYRTASGNSRAVGNALGFYRPVRSDILLDDVVEQYVKEYTPVDQDVPFSAVGIDTPGESSQIGYYIFKPPKTSSAPIDSQGFLDLAENGTGWAGRSGVGRSASDRNRLKKVNIQIKEGFGLEGNETGGAIGASLDLPPAPVPITLPPPPPPPVTSVRIPKAPLTPLRTQPTLGSKPRLPKATPRSRGPSQARVPRIGRRIPRPGAASGPGGATPPLSPGGLSNLFGPRF
jgi:hypothetical protein